MIRQTFIKSIKNNIHGLVPSIFNIVNNYDMIGFGETPHRVNEYYPIISMVIKNLVEKNHNILILLEKGWWLGPDFKKYLNGNENDFLNIIKNDPKASAGQVSFYKELASLSQKNPNMLNCSFIDIFTHQENKHFFDIANSISFDKLKKSNQAFDALKNGHCLLRENFLFQESLSQIKKKHFSKIILLLGGIHIRSKGGTPNGVDFVESLYSRLKKELSIDSINFTFLALSGHHGILKKQNEKIISISQKLPKLDSDMELLKSTIRDFEQSYGLIKSSDIITHQDMNNDFLEWINSYDYILPCKKITPDLNPFSYSVRINF